jgi:PadR family transcriptional regulator, regulatory protein PadR
MGKRKRSAFQGEMLQGTLDLLVLKILAPGPAHGHTIAKLIQQRSEDFLQVEEGSLYPALYRLEERGWLEGYWAVTETNRRARYYRLTEQGRAQLLEQTTGWERMVRAIGNILHPAEDER